MLPEKMVLRTSGASRSGNSNSGVLVTELLPWGGRRRRHASFNVEIDLYIAADHRCRLADAIVHPVGAKAAMRAHHLSLPAFDRPLQFERHIHVLSDAVDCERAVGHVVIALLLDRLALEGDFGELLDIKIIRRAQIVVAIGNVSVDARR